MEEINDALTVANTPPEEAARNIERSEIFDVPPDNYVELRPQLQPEAESMERENIAQTGVNNYIKQSREHASLAKNDIEKMNYIERQARFIWQHVSDIPTIDREIVDLSNKDMDSDEGISESERSILSDLNSERQSLGQEDYGIDGPIEQLPGQIIGAVSEVVRAVSRNAELVGSLTAAGAAAGGLATLGVPVPGARVVGVGAGAAKGFVLGTTVAGFVDGYNYMRGSVFNELSRITDDEGTPLNLDKETRVNISHAVSLVAGASVAIVGGAVAKNNPLLKKFISPKVAAQVVNNPALRAKLNIAGFIAKSAMTGGGAGAITELARFFGEEYAKSDKSEASFTEILDNLTSAETIERFVKAGVIGAGAAGTIATATGVAGYRSLKQRLIKAQVKGKPTPRGKRRTADETIIEEPPQITFDDQGNIVDQKAITKSTKVLNAQDAFDNIAKASNATDIKKFSPGEMSRAKKMMFSAVGINTNVWMHIEDLRTFSNTPEKAKMVRDIVDPSGILTEAHNPTPIETHVFLDIVEKFPEFSDYVRLNPEGPNPLEARNYVERLTEAKGKRGELLSSLGIEGEMTPELQLEVEQALQPSQEAKAIFSENEYFTKPTFTEAIEGVLSKKEVADFNEAQMSARIEVAKSLRADVDKEFSTVENKTFKTLNEIEIGEQLKDQSENFSIVKKFKRETEGPIGEDLKKFHKKKGFSPYAIDPESLPENLKEVYLSDKTLKKRKVFVEGGLPLEEAAGMLGAKDGQQLLKTLIETPSKTELLKQRTQNKIDIRNKIQQSLKPQKVLKQEEVFSNLTKAHLREMSHMRTKDWSKTKAGIKRIVSPLPKIEDLNTKAIAVVNKTMIKDLNARRFMVGENKSQKAAVKHILNNEVEQAFKAKENAAFNSELVKETIKMRERVVRAEKFIKKINRPETQQELRDARMLSAANEILDVYKLDLNKRGMSKQGSFDKFVKQQVREGNVNFEIPEKFNNIKESANELTSEQYLALTDRLKSIVHQAKMKNKLYRKFKEKELIQTEEAIVTEASRLLEEHPDFNEKKSIVVPEVSLSAGEKIQGTIDTGFTLVKSLKTIATTLDQEKPGGFFFELLAQPIIDKRQAKLQELGNFIEHTKKIIDNYGIKKFNDAFSDMRFIKEFIKYPTLGLGWVRKTDLMVLQAYLGDPQGIQRIPNFVTKDGERMTVDIAQDILNRELDESDVGLVQNLFHNVFKSYEQESFHLHVRTTGQEPRMVKGTAFNHRGKGYSGGYYPLKYQYVTDNEQIKRYIDRSRKKAAALFGGEDSTLYTDWQGYQMTDQGRFETRTNSSRPLDLSIKNFFTEMEALIHDVTFREMGIDQLKLLKNPVLAKSIKSVVGPKDYRLLVNSTVETIGEMQERNSNYYGEQFRFIDDLFKTFKTGHAIGTLAGSVSSIAIQSVSLPTAALRMGGKVGTKYIARSVKKIASNLHMLNDFIKIAEEINPDIKFRKDGIDDTLIKSSYEFLPTNETFFKKWKKGTKALSAVKQGQKFATGFLMSGMSEADRVLKIVVTNASYEQFTSGDVANFPESRLKKMSKDEIHKAASNYSKQITQLGLTASSIEDKAAIEKFVVSKLFTRYWTDLRAQLNTYLAQGRKIKWSSKKSYEQFKGGEFKQSGESAYNAAGSLMSLVVAATVMKLATDLLRGEETPLDDISDVRSKEDLKELGKKTLVYFGSSVPDAITDATPLVRDIKYGYFFKGRSDYRSVSIPLLKSFGDVAIGISGLADTLDIALGGEATISSTELKGMLFSASYLTGGIPVNGFFKLNKYLESEQFIDAVDYVSSETSRLNTSINNFIKKFEGRPEAQDYIESLKEIQTEVLPQYTSNTKDIIPENTKEVIKEVSSGGEWDKLDPETGATGLYQFTEDRWNEIKGADNSLGLTDNGRVSKDTRQQEKAMEWSTQDNTRGLVAFDVPVNVQTLYGSHKFGLENYVKIYNADKDQTLTKVLGTEAANDPVFNNFTSVNSIKRFVSKTIGSVK